MKIYDCFYFFDELELLKIRLNILDSYVDYFLIVEADESYYGKEKCLIYKKNYEYFSKWNHKIIHHVVDRFPNNKKHYEKALNSPNTGPNHLPKDHWWLREFYQKETFIDDLLDCNDEDIIFISDIDEIWNPKIKISVEQSKVYRPIQTTYPFYLNNRSNQNINCWTGTRFSNFKTLKNYGPNHIRTEREVSGIPIPDGGWHFSWLGKKMDKYGDGHPDAPVRFNMIKNVNMWKDESELPSYILDNKKELVEKNLMMP